MSKRPQRLAHGAWKLARARGKLEMGAMATRAAFGGRMGGRKLHSANLYQLLTYLQNRQAALPEGPRHEGMLLYPAVGETFAVDVTLNGFRVQARSVDLGRGWRAIEGELLGAVLPAGLASPPDAQLGDETLIREFIRTDKRRDERRLGHDHRVARTSYANHLVE